MQKKTFFFQRRLCFFHLKNKIISDSDRSGTVLVRKGFHSFKVNNVPLEGDDE